MKILRFISFKENLIFKIHGIDGIKLVNRLRLRLSHLNEHKFRHNLRIPIDSICSCGLEPEKTHHYFLCCNFCSDLRIEFLNDNCTLNPPFSRKTFECSPVWRTIKFLKNCERFNRPLLTFYIAKNIK